MKNNKKTIDLIKKGFSIKTLSNLSETQINVLHSKIISEQVTKTTTTSYNIPQDSAMKGVSVDTGGKKNISIQQTPSGIKATPTEEGKLEEIEEDMVDINVVDDKDATEDGMGIFEKENKGKTKKKKSTKKVPNPWAICHAQLGPKKTRKFERCVREVKKSLSEGKNPVSLFLESQIMKIVEKNIPPRITKGDLLKYLSEDTKTAPAKPKTKPGVKPDKGEPKKKPGHPGKNPNPGEKIAPKAGVDEDTTTAPAKPKTKPETKPGKPAPKPRPGHPGKNPNPGENPAPKAISPERAKDEVINLIMKMLEK
jgi:hypothetical protein